MLACCVIRWSALLTIPFLQLLGQLRSDKAQRSVKTVGKRTAVCVKGKAQAPSCEYDLSVNMNLSSMAQAQTLGAGQQLHGERLAAHREIQRPYRHWLSCAPLSFRSVKPACFGQVVCRHQQSTCINLSFLASVGCVMWQGCTDVQLHVVYSKSQCQYVGLA